MQPVGSLEGLRVPHGLLDAVKFTIPLVEGSGAGQFLHTACLALAPDGQLRTQSNRVPGRFLRRHFLSLRSAPGLEFAETSVTLTAGGNSPDPSLAHVVEVRVEINAMRLLRLHLAERGTCRPAPAGLARRHANVLPAKVLSECAEDELRRLYIKQLSLIDLQLTGVQRWLRARLSGKGLPPSAQRLDIYLQLFQVAFDLPLSTLSIPFGDLFAAARLIIPGIDKYRNKRWAGGTTKQPSRSSRRADSSSQLYLKDQVVRPEDEVGYRTLGKFREQRRWHLGMRWRQVGLLAAHWQRRRALWQLVLDAAFMALHCVNSSAELAEAIRRQLRLRAGDALHRITFLIEQLRAGPRGTKKVVTAHMRNRLRDAGVVTVVKKGAWVLCWRQLARFAVLRYVALPPVGVSEELAGKSSMNGKAAVGR